MRLFCNNLILNSGKNAELAFHCNVELMCVFYNLLGESYVLIVRKSGAVYHH